MLYSHTSQLLADRSRPLGSSVLPCLDRFPWAWGFSQQQGVLSEVITWKGYIIHCLPCLDFLLAGSPSLSIQAFTWRKLSCRECGETFSTSVLYSLVLSARLVHYRGAKCGTKRLQPGFLWTCNKVRVKNRGGKETKYIEDAKMLLGHINMRFLQVYRFCGIIEATPLKTRA